MAEPFGIATGVAGLASVFTNCITCFEYIQLGRHFGEDYQRCLLKLDIVQNRLTRWGDSVGLYDPETPGFQSLVGASPSDIKTATNTFEDILDLFEDIQKKSKRFERGVKPEELTVYDPKVDLDKVTKPLHQHFQGLSLSRRARAKERQKGTSIKQKLFWALYEKKNFDKLIDDITSLVDGLTDMFPQAYQTQCDVATLEVSAIKDIVSVELLVDVAGKDDKFLQESGRKVIEESKGHIYWGNETGDNARERRGDEYALGWTGNIQGGQNVYEGNSTMGEAVVHMGNSYGGKSIFDT